MSDLVRTYFVRVTDNQGTFDTPRVGIVNAKLAFDAWMANLGDTCIHVQRFAVYSDGSEVPCESASLRSDLHDKVKRRAGEASRADETYTQQRMFE